MTHDRHGRVKTNNEVLKTAGKSGLAFFEESPALRLGGQGDGNRERLWVALGQRLKCDERQARDISTHADPEMICGQQTCLRRNTEGSG